MRISPKGLDDYRTERKTAETSKPRRKPKTPDDKANLHDSIIIGRNGNLILNSEKWSHLDDGIPALSGIRDFKKT